MFQRGLGFALCIGAAVTVWGSRGQPDFAVGAVLGAIVGGAGIYLIFRKGS